MLSSIESLSRPAFPREQAVLIVADNREAASELRDAFSQAGMGEVTTATFAQASETIDWASITLALMLPAISKESYFLISRIRKSWLASSIPVIVVAGHEGSTEVVENLKMGFDVAIPAPADPNVVIEYAKSLLRRRAILVEQSPLTEMPGASVFRSVVENHVALRRAIAVCRVDIDRLKSVVDKYGFARGSAIISALAEALETSASKTRPRPFVAHVGGDDFLVLCQPRLVRAITTRVTVLFERAADKIYDPDDVHRGYVELLSRRQEMVRAALVTLSSGVVVTTQRRKISYEDLLQKANEMLVVAKSQPGSYVALTRYPG
ncbi:diguanylate cyclase [Micromonospora sp. NPDC048947]|uniref:diguanylate cyclase domain-containing protein n=1 Tax=Micromonospora sp. NPDC048947 TaxID=3154826 RepID=UPI00340552AE